MAGVFTGRIMGKGYSDRMCQDDLGVPIPASFPKIPTSDQISFSTCWTPRKNIFSVLTSFDSTLPCRVGSSSHKREFASSPGRQVFVIGDTDARDKGDIGAKVIGDTGDIATEGDDKGDGR